MRRRLSSGTVLIGALAVFVVLIAAMAAVVVLALAHADSAIDAIQRSRLELCRQQNERHDHTIRTLDKQIAKLPPKERRRAIRQRAGTVALINALAPKRDCARVIAPRP